MKSKVTPESLHQRTVPDWFHDAKLGIFIHWGLYSVPAWALPTGELGKVDWDVWFAQNPYAEWYMNSMRIEGGVTQRHHIETYGPDFHYEDFIPLFNDAIQAWDPGAMADLFREAGARYAVLTTKHHDGFLLWPSATPNPFRKEYHAARDLVGELTEAVRTREMYMGLYYSGGIDWTFNKTVIQSLADIQDAVPQGDEYVAYANAHWQELIARYKPSVMWNDIAYPAAADLNELFAHYYNSVPEGVINDRFTQRFEFSEGQIAGSQHSDFRTPEYTSYDHIVEKKWEATRGIGYSFGYNQNEGPENYLSVQELVHSFVDIVSKNGNLLLNVGPMADGTIPALQRERLEGLGTWLHVNGEAIYGTRPWTHADGKTADGTEVRYTQKEEALYAIVLGQRQGDRVHIVDLPVPDGVTVTLLGKDEPAPWEREGDGITVSLPGKPRESVAYALRLHPRQ